MDDRPADADRAPAPAAPEEYSAPRPAPRFGVFVGSGFVIGLVAAVVLTAVGTPAGQAGYGAVLGYLVVSLGLLGALLGGGVAALLDSVTGSRRRRRRPGRRGTLVR